MFSFEDAFLIGRGEKNMCSSTLPLLILLINGHHHNHHQQPLTLGTCWPGAIASLRKSVRWPSVQMDVKPPGCQSKMKVKPWDP